MLRAQEGFDAGYYSGIATVHEGKLKIEKKDFETDLSGITARSFILSIEE